MTYDSSGGFAHLATTIHVELTALRDSKVESTVAALEHLFTTLFDHSEQPPDLKRRFFMYAAPLCRRIMVMDPELERGHDGQSETVDWFNWLDSHDPLRASMIDLHYMAGLTLHETALALNVTLEEVEKGILEAKARLRQVSAKRARRAPGTKGSTT